MKNKNYTVKMINWRRRVRCGCIPKIRFAGGISEEEKKKLIAGGYWMRRYQGSWVTRKTLWEAPL